MKSVLILDGLNCPNCAQKIETKLKNDARFENVEFNFINKELSLEHKLDKKKLIAEVDMIVSGIESGVTVLERPHEHGHKHEHEHEHEHEHGHEHEHEHGHGHEHGHSHSHGRSSKLLFLTRAVIVIFLLAVYFIFFKHPVIIILAYLTAGYDVIFSSVRNIARGNFLDENFLMSIATAGALILGEYTEAAAVMIFYQIGEYCQDMAVDHSRRSISELMSLKVETADIVRGDSIVSAPPEEIETGDILLIKSGAKIPVDGEVTEGESVLDTSALTGESLPRDISAGSKVLSGCINKGSAFKMCASSVYSESTAVKISKMAENAAAHKAKAENFISVFARFYTPAVVLAAVLLALIPCLIGGFDVKWIYRGLIFLVASCPCALVLSVPLCFFSGIGKASKQGVLIKGSNYIQTLSSIKAVAFDKTGTLTTGEFSVADPDKEVLAYAAALEQYSTHPIAKAILSAYGGTPATAENVEEIGGFGLKGLCDGSEVAVGSRGLMKMLDIDCKEHKGDVFVAKDGIIIGTLSVTDTIRKDSAVTIRSLEAMGIKTAMLTGDRPDNAIAAGQKLGISAVKGGLLPGSKLSAVEELQKKYGSVAFVGDGINDAPVLAGADIGIAMGGIGSDAAIEAADMVIMGDEPSAVIRAVRTSVKTMSVLKQNVIFVIGVKLAVLFITAIGLGNMWLAVFADVGTALLAVLNSARILK